MGTLEPPGCPTRLQGAPQVLELPTYVYYTVHYLYPRYYTILHHYATAVLCVSMCVLLTTLLPRSYIRCITGS